MTKASEMNKPPEPATPRELEAALTTTVTNLGQGAIAQKAVWKIVISHIKTIANADRR